MSVGDDLAVVGDVVVNGGAVTISAGTVAAGALNSGGYVHAVGDLQASNFVNPNPVTVGGASIVDQQQTFTTGTYTPSANANFVVLSFGVQIPAQHIVSVDYPWIVDPVTSEPPYIKVTLTDITDTSNTMVDQRYYAIQGCFVAIPAYFGPRIPFISGHQYQATIVIDTCITNPPVLLDQPGTLSPCIFTSV